MSQKIKWVSSKGKKAVKRKTAAKTAAKTAFIILLILMIGIVAFIMSLGFYIDSLDTVFPNVYADGIKLSGMTLAEATRTLINAGYESNADGVSATIIFPDDSSFTVTGNEVGFSLNAEDAAKAAYGYGRGGSLLANEIVYIKAYLTRTDLRDVSKTRFDASLIRSLAAAYTKAFNDTLIDDYYSIGRNSITIIKGAEFTSADEEAVYDLAVKTIMQAMEEQKHLIAEYTPGASTSQEIDLTLLYNRITIEPVSSVYDPKTFGATESEKGVSFDLKSAQTKLNSAEIGVAVVIPLIVLEPEINREDIEVLLFRDVLSETKTNILGTSNRLNNITLAAEAIDGKQMNKGDVFSFNETVGPRTAERGYREAGAYINGMTVNEIGGGICQTSSTLYNSVLLADLEVVERQPHMFTVSYLPLGSDATINWGTIDFKFRNSTDYPIRIETTINGRDITVKLIGTKLDDNYIKTFYTLISTTPFEVVEKEDESVQPGERIQKTDGSTGFVVDTYKYYYDAEDNLIDEKLVGRSTYYVQNKLILIPIETEEEDTDEEDPDGEDPGGEDPGGEVPGGEDPGGEYPGGEVPGGEDPGGEDPDVENPPEGPDTPPEGPDTPPEGPDTPPETDQPPPEQPTEPTNRQEPDQPADPPDE